MTFYAHRHESFHALSICQMSWRLLGAWSPCWRLVSDQRPRVTAGLSAGLSDIKKMGVIAEGPAFFRASPEGAWQSRSFNEGIDSC
jgi:hypothetical protein